jgi:hypothetical protein
VRQWYGDAFPEAKPLKGHKGPDSEVSENRLNFSVLRCTEEGVRLGLTSDRKTALGWGETLGQE